MGIIVKKEIYPNNYGIITLIINKESYNFRWDGKSVLKQAIRLSFVSEELIKEFKLRLQWANQFQNKQVDNLTYIEVLNQFNERTKSQ